MTTTRELWVVPTERHVEVAAAEGKRAETRRSLRERLARAFVQNTRFAGDAVRRLALAESLPSVLEAERVRVHGPAALQRTADAVDDALRALREVGVDAAALGAVEVGVPRARLLRRAMNALDERLARVGLVDERLAPFHLARALAATSPEAVVDVVGAPRVRARLLLRWDADRAWWTALDAALAAAGGGGGGANGERGGTSVELPALSRRLDAERALDPFERIQDDVARALDEAADVAHVEPMLGDASFTGAVPDAARTRISLRRALDADAQARAVVGAVREALESGAPPERIAIGLPRGASEAVTAALERTFEAAEVPLHVAADRRVRGSFVELALGLLEAGPAKLPRKLVARLLRARSLDARRIARTSDLRPGRALLEDLADALEGAPTVDLADPLEQLVATASASDRRGSQERRAQRAELARRVGEILLRADRSMPRAEHVAAARALFDAFGLSARPGAAVRAVLASDATVAPLATTELEAFARDARASESLDAALEAIAAAAQTLGANEPCPPATFRHELGRALEGRGAGAAGRAFAVRAAPIEDLAGVPLDTLVVVDVNEGGALGARGPLPALVSPALEDALRRRDARASLAGANLVGARSAVALAIAVESAQTTVLCYRTTDEDGATLAPAPVAFWLERGGVPSRSVHASPLLGEPVTPHERELVLLWLDPEHAASLAPHAARVSEREAERERFHDGSAPATEVVGLLRSARQDSPEVARILELETGGGGRPLAVTALERIGRCAFQGFAAQVLGALDADGERADTPDRREEGILVHDALGAAFTEVGARWRTRPRDRAAILEAALRAADERLRSPQAAMGTPLRRVALDRLRAEVERVVSLAVDDEEWDFFAAERGFGNAGDEWPALVAEEDGVRVALRGRIDRVDLAHGGSAAQVVDYKRRITLPPLRELGEEAMQIPVYAVAVARALGLASATGRYLSTASPRPAGQGFQKRLAELVSPTAAPPILASALVRVRALREGRIDPTPHRPSTCTHCGLDGACRRPRFAVTMLAHAGSGGGGGSGSGSGSGDER